MKAGLKRTFNSVTQEQLEISSRPQWKPLLFAVAFLHSTVQVNFKKNCSKTQHNLPVPDEMLG